MLTVAPVDMSATALRRLNLEPTPRLQAWARDILHACQERYADDTSADHGDLLHEVATGAVPAGSPAIAALVAEDAGRLLLREPKASMDRIWLDDPRTPIAIAARLLYDAAYRIAADEISRLDDEYADDPANDDYSSLPAYPIPFDKLAALPTISESQTSNLKLEARNAAGVPIERVWLARTGPADGEPCANRVTVERQINGHWQTLGTWRAI